MSISSDFDGKVDKISLIVTYNLWVDLLCGLRVVPSISLPPISAPYCHTSK